ncbi:hypothetical protein CRENBAI_009401 [Crenichthys baileyi]|uniref:Uncharacterized protein n=1 Tax=Crenichthys baileyi TaxID=28760 RepID=A0AAV9S5Q6_9TELE
MLIGMRACGATELQNSRIQPIGKSMSWLYDDPWEQHATRATASHCCSGGVNAEPDTAPGDPQQPSRLLPPQPSLSSSSSSVFTSTSSFSTSSSSSSSCQGSIPLFGLGNLSLENKEKKGDGRVQDHLFHRSLIWRNLLGKSCKPFNHLPGLTVQTLNLKVSGWSFVMRGIGMQGRISKEQSRSSSYSSQATFSVFDSPADTLPF